MTQPSGRAGRSHTAVDASDRWIDGTFEFPVIFKSVSLSALAGIGVAAIHPWLSAVH